MLRESLGATPADLATRGCSNRSVGQNTSPLSRAVDLRLRAAADDFLWFILAARGCLRLLAASRKPTLTRPKIARPGNRIALRVARLLVWSGFAARGSS